MKIRVCRTESNEEVERMDKIMKGPRKNRYNECNAKIYPSERRMFRM